MLLVPRVCAARIVEDVDLKGENGAILMDMYHKIWSASQSKYQTYEQELYMMVKYISKKSRFLAKAIAEWSGSSLSKLGLYTDSSTACSKWLNITVPLGLIDHISAAERRLLSPRPGVRCRCGYLSQSRSSLCEREGHDVRRLQAVKRFFECGGCKGRISLLNQRLPETEALAERLRPCLPG